MIATRVSEMGHHWHPTVGPDSGIDGEIELVDQATGAVRNFRIAVQSKATEGIWRSENSDGFVFRASNEDIAYWLGSNQPVIVVCSRPKSDEAYFRDIQEWAKAPERRASGLIDFNKRSDRFDASAAARLFTLEAREQVELDPPGPIPQPELATTNMLPVIWDTEHVWATVTPADEWSAVFSAALDAGVPRSDFVLRDARLWTLTELSDAFLGAIDAEYDPEQYPIDDFAYSEDRSRTNLLAELARRSLTAQHHKQLRWSGREHVAYFKLYENRPERKFKWAGGPGRTVVRPRKSQNHDGLSGYRHDAAKLRFKRLGGCWMLSISPSYLFTFDGRQMSTFHADALKKMKSLDRSTAVSQQVRMWAYLFTQNRSVFDAGEPPPFHFGELVEISMPVSPPEAAWVPAPDDIRGADFYDSDKEIEEEPDLTLFDWAGDPW